MKLLRYILFPIVPFYYLATWFRNKLYDFGIKSSASFDIPIICVGNLSVGGTGKTPMIEYLIVLLKNDYLIATLSRGYKRKTHGFVIAGKSTEVTEIGDEPFQYYEKFKDIIVSVDSNRRNGIHQLLKLKAKPDVILLDDAFQHRKVKAGFTILLTTFDELYSKDLVLPTGNLREPKSGAKRANVIVVTKCPQHLSNQEKNEIIDSLKPKKEQHVFFGSISYSKSVWNGVEEKPLESFKTRKFTLVTGIANSKPMVQYLKSEGLKFEHLNYKDHHEFSVSEINDIKSRDLVLTTEKDFMRIKPYAKNQNNVYYLPIETILDNAKKFDGLIRKFMTDFY